MCHQGSGAQQLSLIGARHSQKGDVAEGREGQKLAQTNLALIKALKVLRAGKTNDLTIGIVGLNDCHSLFVGASRATDDLRQHGKCTFCGAVIVQIKRGIGKQHTNECDIGEIVSLCHHLCAEKDVCLVCAKTPEQLVVCEFCGRRVGVHSQNIGVGEQRLQLLLNTLRAKAHAGKMLGVTVGTLLWQRHTATAPMANEVTLVPRAAARVIGHCHRARGTGDRLTAGAAANEMVISAAVDKKHRLLSRACHAAKLAHQLLTKRRKTSALHLTAHIGNFDLGQFCRAEAMLERNEGISSLFCLLVALQRGRCRGQKHERLVVRTTVARNVARVVFWVLVRFIRVFLFFVNDDGTQVFDR